MLVLSFLLLSSDQVAAAPVSEPAVTATSAPAVTSEDGFVVGRDTYETVTNKLGKPKFYMTNSDGTRIIAYSTMRGRVKGTTFIPIVGLFAGGAKASVTVKTFIFDKNGVLSSFTSSGGNSNCDSSVAGVDCH
jgi:hypothetical protein